MFSKLSLNRKVPGGKRTFDSIMCSNKSSFSFGLPEWQQSYTTTSKIFHSKKNLKDNIAILDKDYLKPNFSGFKLIHFPQAKPFLTSNRRDFIKYSITDDEKSKSNVEQIKHLRRSNIEMGEYIPEKLSMYKFLHNDPKDQVPRFDYNKIKYKYNLYNLHPITQEQIIKDPNRMNPFDYFNRDKNKRYVTNHNLPYINTDYKKVWDPITNRFFVGSLRCHSENKSS